MAIASISTITSASPNSWQEAAELGRDLGFEPAVPDADGVVALLLGADPDTAVAGDTVVVVPEDERVFVGLVRGARAPSREPAGAGRVPVEQVAQFLGGVAGEFLVLGVSGTLHDPIVQVRLLGGLADELDRLFVPQKQKKR